MIDDLGTENDILNEVEELLDNDIDDDIIKNDDIDDAKVDEFVSTFDDDIDIEDIDDETKSDLDKIDEEIEQSELSADELDKKLEMLDEEIKESEEALDSSDVDEELDIEIDETYDELAESIDNTYEDVTGDSKIEKVSTSDETDRFDELESIDENVLKEALGEESESIDAIYENNVSDDIDFQEEIKNEAVDNSIEILKEIYELLNEKGIKSKLDSNSLEITITIGKKSE